MKVFYSPEYVSAKHAFATTRKAGWVVESLAADPIAGIELVAPQSVTEATLRIAHGQVYVNAVRTGTPQHLASSQGFPWDPQLYPMVAASTGGVIDAALAALHDGVAGSLSSGLHHAYRDSGGGFCTFNGLALAAKIAVGAGAERVLIVDFDAHCGGGTASLIRQTAIAGHLTQVDVSVDPFDEYADTDNATLELVTDPARYLDACERALADTDGRYDLILYNAGMDPHELVPVGGLPGITREILAAREQLVFDFAAQNVSAVAFVLAGGYLGPDLDEAGLVDLHRLTLAEAARHA